MILFSFQYEKNYTAKHEQSLLACKLDSQPRDQVNNFLITYILINIKYVLKIYVNF